MQLTLTQFQDTPRFISGVERLQGHLGLLIGHSGAAARCASAAALGVQVATFRRLLIFDYHANH